MATKQKQGIRLMAKFPAALFFAEIKIKSWQVASSASRQSHDLLFFSQGQLGRAMTYFFFRQTGL